MSDFAELATAYWAEFVAGGLLVLVVVYVLVVNVKGCCNATNEPESELYLADPERGGLSSSGNVSKKKSREDSHRATNQKVLHDSVVMDTWGTRFPGVIVGVSCIIYYYDVLTDLRFAMQISSCKSEGDDDPTPLLYSIISILVIHTILLTIIDLKRVREASNNALHIRGSSIWFIVALNVTQTRMLFCVWETMQGGNQEENVKATTDIKLFEAVFESVPQLYIQCIALLHYNTQCNDLNNFALYSSMGVSTLSITYSIASKFLYIIDRDDCKAALIAAWYFLADAVTRALGVAMIYGALGGYALIGLAFAYPCVDLLVRCVTEDHHDRDNHADTSYMVRMFFSFFTAMPISSSPYDKVQLFYESSVFTLLFMVIASVKNYDNMYSTYSSRDDSCGSIFTDGRAGRLAYNGLCEEPVFMGDVGACVVGTDCTDCSNCAETLPPGLADVVRNASQFVNSTDGRVLAALQLARNNATFLNAHRFPQIVVSDAMYTVSTFTYVVAFGGLVVKILFGLLVMRLKNGPDTGGRSGLSIFQLTPGMDFKGFTRFQWTDYFTRGNNVHVNFSFRRRLDQVTGREMVRALSDVLETGECTVASINLQNVDAYKWLLPEFKRQGGYNELADPEKVGPKLGALHVTDRKLMDLFTYLDEKGRTISLFELNKQRWRELYDQYVSQRHLASPVYEPRDEDGVMKLSNPVRWEWVAASGTQLEREEVQRVKQLRRQALRSLHKRNNGKASLTGIGYGSIGLYYGPQEGDRPEINKFDGTAKWKSASNNFGFLEHSKKLVLFRAPPEPLSLFDPKYLLQALDGNEKLNFIVNNEPKDAPPPTNAVEAKNHARSKDGWRKSIQLVASLWRGPHGVGHSFKHCVNVFEVQEDGKYKCTSLRHVEDERRPREARKGDLMWGCPDCAGAKPCGTHGAYLCHDCFADVNPEQCQADVAKLEPWGKKIKLLQARSRSPRRGAVKHGGSNPVKYTHNSGKNKWQCLGVYEASDHKTECSYCDHIDSLHGKESMLVAKGTLMWGCEMCGVSFCDECFSLVDQKKHSADKRAAQGTIRKRDASRRVLPQRSQSTQAWADAGEHGIETDL